MALCATSLALLNVLQANATNWGVHASHATLGTMAMGLLAKGVLLATVVPAT